jgi:hypothetical protein
LEKFFALASPNTACAIDSVTLYADDLGQQAWTNTALAALDANNMLVITQSALSTSQMVHVFVSAGGIVKSQVRVVISVNKRPCGYETINYNVS